MPVEVLMKEFKVPKKTQFGTIERSTGQDFVYVMDEAKRWVHCGYLTHSSLLFMPIVGVPQELVPQIAEACAKQKGKPIGSIPSIPVATETEVSGDGDDDDDDK